MESKTFIIDFGGNILARILIEENEPVVLNCMDGYGNAVDPDKIIISIDG